MNDDRVIIFDTTLRDGEQSPGDLAEHEREARDRAAARAPGGGRHRGRLPDRLAGRLRGRAGDRPPGRGPGHRRPRARSCGGHRCRLRGGTRRRAASDPHVRLDVGHPHRAPAGLDARGRQGPGARRGRARAVAGRRRRVLPDGRHAGGRRVHRRGRADRDRRGRDDDQHPRHRRLHDARGVPGVPGPALRAGARAARRRAVGPLPRRPRAGGRQLVRRAAGGRAAGRVRDQRDRRAGGQRLARGDRDAAAHARRRRRRAAHRHQHARDRAHLAADLAPHRLPGAAEQGDRGPQRVRPRVRHPPGRRAQGALDLRDHGRDDRRARGQLAGAGQALRPPRAQERAGGAGLRRLRPGAEHGVQALQGDRGQEEAGHRDGPRGAGHRRAPRRHALLHARVVRRRGLDPPPAARDRAAADARRRGGARRLHRRRPGRRDLPRHQRGDQARGAACASSASTR